MSKSLQIHSLYNVVELLRDYDINFSFHVEAGGETSIIPSYGNWCLEDMVKRFDKIEIVADMGKTHREHISKEQEIADIVSEVVDWRKIKKVSIKDRGLSYNVGIFLGVHNPSLYRYSNILTLADNENATVNIFNDISFDIQDIHKLENVLSKILEVIDKLRKEETRNESRRD